MEVISLLSAYKGLKRVGTSLRSSTLQRLLSAYKGLKQ